MTEEAKGSNTIRDVFRPIAKTGRKRIKVAFFKIMLHQNWFIFGREGELSRNIETWKRMGEDCGAGKTSDPSEYSGGTLMIPNVAFTNSKSFDFAYFTFGILFAVFLWFLPLPC